VHDVFGLAFPMIVECRSLTFVLFDTNAPASMNVTNAFGRIPEDALRRAQVACRLLERRQEPPTIVFCGHHHAALAPADVATVRPEEHPNVGTISGPSSWQNRMRDKAISQFMVLANASELLSLVLDVSPSIYFHGHKHVEQVLEIADATFNRWGYLVSATSTTLGDDDGPLRPRFRRFAITADGPHVVADVDGFAARSA
jgi:hypothetical protein